MYKIDTTWAGYKLKEYSIPAVPLIDLINKINEIQSALNSGDIQTNIPGVTLRVTLVKLVITDDDGRICKTISFES